MDSKERSYELKRKAERSMQGRRLEFPQWVGVSASAIIPRMFKSGQHIEAKTRAVIENTTDGQKLIVDFGHAQTATIHERDVVQEEVR